MFMNKKSLIFFIIIYNFFISISAIVISDKNILETINKNDFSNIFIFIDYDNFFTEFEKELIEHPVEYRNKELIFKKYQHFSLITQRLKSLKEDGYKIFFITSHTKSTSNLQEALHSIGICLHSYHFPYGITCESAQSYKFFEPYNKAKILFNDAELGFLDFVLYAGQNSKQELVNEFLRVCNLGEEALKSHIDDSGLRKRNSNRPNLRTSSNNL
jgi:hypothetical protein